MFIFEGEGYDADTDPPTLDGYNYVRPSSSMSVRSVSRSNAKLGFAKDSITYTAEMFGDIESHRTSKVSSTNGSQKGANSDVPVERKSCLSRNIKDDEYAQSLANGFTIIIDSVDDANSFDFSSLSSDEEGVEEHYADAVESKSVTFKDDYPNDMIDEGPEDDGCDNDDGKDKDGDNDENKELKNQRDDKNGDGDGDAENRVNSRTESNKDHETKTDSKAEDRAERGCSRNDSGERSESRLLNDNQEICETVRAQSAEGTKAVHKKKTQPKPSPPGTSKPKPDAKNKLGLKLKIENEMMTTFSPYIKSSTSKSKSNTNKARQMYSMGSKGKKSNGSIPSSLKANGKTPNGKDAKKLSPDSAENSGATETVIGARRERLTSTDGLEVVCNTTVNSPMASDNHQITCVADVHREKTLSPKTENGDVTSRSAPTSPRHRKISVISIGSVLKDGRETLV